MSSAIRFNLDQSKILLSGNGLTKVMAFDRITELCRSIQHNNVIISFVTNSSVIRKAKPFSHYIQSVNQPVCKSLFATHSRLEIKNLFKT